jgi:hypothetical protein
MLNFLNIKTNFGSQNKSHKNVEDATKKWCWKDSVILVQFIVITVLWYKIM